MMDESVGEINYDADARLYFGAHYYPEKQFHSNYMHLLNLKMRT